MRAWQLDSWYFEPSDLSGNSFDDPVSEHRDLTEELHIEMGTDNNSGATWWYQIDDGINNVLNKKGYSSWASNRVATSANLKRNYRRDKPK